MDNVGVAVVDLFPAAVEHVTAALQEMPEVGGVWPNSELQPFS